MAGPALLPGPALAPTTDPMIPTVFHEPWWLDIVTARRWTAAEVTEDGRVVGQMPYYVSRRLRGQVIAMPPFTHFLGPALLPAKGARQTQWLRGLEVTRELVRRLPPGLRFWQKFHRDITDVVPFQAEKFDTGVQFTFEVEPAPEEVLWAAMRDKHRNVIRRAQERFAIEDMTDGAEFTRLYQANVEHRIQVTWAPADVMQQLLTTATERGRGQMLGLRDGAGNLTAAVFCARDLRSTYYTLSTRRPDAGNGAIPLLIWESIRRSARDGLMFDFDGLSNGTSIRLFAGFGGRTSPRYFAARSLPSKVIRSVRNRLGIGASTFGGGD